MIRISTLPFVFFILFASSVQSINLRGTVTSQSGNPIPDAVVSLIGQKLSDTTDRNGAYSIISNTPIINSIAYPAKTSTDKISIQNGILRISLSNAFVIKTELFNIHGKLLGRIRDNSSYAGDCIFNIQKYLSTNNMMIIRVIVDGNSAIFRYSPLQNRSRVLRSSINTSTNSIALQKEAPVFDTLHISANNYMPKEEPVSAYEGVINIKLDSVNLPLFSFFVTSLEALRELSGSKDGFGGDLRFGETGPGAGLRGADKICECIAEKSMPGSKVKQWRAFLSVSADENGKQVDARDRIGNGPWYDRLGRLLSPDLDDLLKTRPMNGDPTIKNDLPNEDGIPNHRPDPNKPVEDNHHMLTGSGSGGRLYSAEATCNDWTSTSTGAGRPMSGFSWPRRIGSNKASNWMTGYRCPGCVPGVDIFSHGGAKKGDVTVGGGGGYGGFYCFSLKP